jgi:hypothetical protein
LARKYRALADVSNAANAAARRRLADYLDRQADRIDAQQRDRTASREA